jgi:hypothetical protein
MALCGNQRSWPGSPLLSWTSHEQRRCETGSFARAGTPAGPPKALLRHVLQDQSNGFDWGWGNRRMPLDEAGSLGFSLAFICPISVTETGSFVGQILPRVGAKCDEIKVCALWPLASVECFWPGQHWISTNPLRASAVRRSQEGMPSGRRLSRLGAALQGKHRPCGSIPRTDYG